MSATAGRPAAGFSLFTLVMVSAFVGLGLWQLQRRTEKHALIAALTERLAATPVALPPAVSWHSLTAERDEFRRVQFQATFGAGADAMVYSAGSAVRDDVSGPGTWAFIPSRLPSGETVAVNAGFVQNTMQDRPQQDLAIAHVETGKLTDLVGYIRFPEHAGLLTPAANVGKRLWFVRDHLAMAQALGWGNDGKTLAPFYIDLEQPVPPGGIPKPGPLQVHLKDDHLQYAITWFALAAAVVIAFFVWWRGKRHGAGQE
jgi:cytochrome oxidase assembly protein ShyY1